MLQNFSTDSQRIDQESKKLELINQKIIGGNLNA